MNVHIVFCKFCQTEVDLVTSKNVRDGVHTVCGGKLPVRLPEAAKVEVRRCPGCGVEAPRFCLPGCLLLLEWRARC